MELKWLQYACRNEINEINPKNYKEKSTFSFTKLKYKFTERRHAAGIE